MIQLDRICFRHGSTEILKDISMDFAAGERTILLGRSGSGKSTMLRLINQLLIPSSGSIHYQQLSAKSIGFVSQQLGLFPHRTVAQQITRFLPDPKQFEELVTPLGISSDLYHRYPHQLSGGQKQRVALARALAHDPTVLLLDEPFSALDPLLRRELQDLILTLRKTIVFVTHDLREALRLGQTLVFLREGRIVFNGPPSELPSAEDVEVKAYLRTLDL